MGNANKLEKKYSTLKKLFAANFITGKLA